MSTWYIAPTGNDSTGDGTIGNPYLTVAQCHTVGANGDTVICADGIYRQYGFVISKTNWTIQAGTGATPIFVGSNVYTSWSKTSDKTNVYETSYTSTRNWGFWNDATRLTSTASTTACDALTNSYYFDDAGDKLYVNIGGDAPTAIEVYDGSNDYALVVTGAGATISGLTFKYQIQAVYVQASSEIDNCVFLLWVGYNPQADFAQLLITGATHSVVNCTFSGTVGTCITIASGASSVTITGCTSTGGYRGIDILGGTGHVIDACTVSSATDAGISCLGTGIIRNCCCHDSAGAQIGVDTGGSVIIADCIIYNATANNSYGITVSNGSGYVVTRCVVRDGYRDGILINNASATISHCSIRNFGHAGIWIGGAGTIVVDHCTIDIDHDVATGATGDIYGFVVDPPACTASFYHCVAANLLLSSLGSKKTGWFLQNDGTLTVKNCIATNCLYGFNAVATYSPSLDCDYNCAYANDTDYAGDWSQGTHDIALNPLFVNSLGDYRILADSSCRDAGIALSGINEGFRGGAPDIGVFEYVKPLTRRREWPAFFEGGFLPAWAAHTHTLLGGGPG